MMTFTSRNPAALAQRLAFLKTVPLLAALSERDLAVLEQDWVRRDYTSGQFIFCQGDLSRELYIVWQGKIRIFKTSPQGHETSINIFSRGDVLGEFAAIDGQPRSATAQALGVCGLLVMEGDRFVQRLREMPDLALGMIRLLSGKLRWTAEYAETIAQYDAAGRLLHLLLLYNDQFGEAVEPGKRYELDLALNQTDLATLVGIRREQLNRLLQNWRKQGLIEYTAGRIVILNLARVREERDRRIEALLDSGEA